MCKARQPPALVSIWPFENIAGLRWPYRHGDMGELPGLVEWLCTLSRSMVHTARMGFWGPYTLVKANGVCVHQAPLFDCDPTDLGLATVTWQLLPCPINPGVPWPKYSIVPFLDLLPCLPLMASPLSDPRKSFSHSQVLV